ncbi:conserved hypothetical protein [Treponema pallidum subsp. pallidum str. Chicago]|nr:conserved hypothetical protein [Treponema pallidum subsp. pallidum str. Chicago]
MCEGTRFSVLSRISPARVRVVKERRMRASALSVEEWYGSGDYQKSA